MNQEISLDQLVPAAQEGDNQAWNKLIEKYTPLLWSITRSARLTDADANDVIQATWLRCFEHLEQLRSPAELGGWLATTARREAIRIQRQMSPRQLEHASAQDQDNRYETEAPSAEDEILQAERWHALQRALVQLPAPCRHLFQLMLAEPSVSYAEISAALGIPVGSIGPTRARCLERLRRLLALAEGDIPSAVVPSPQGSASTGTTTRQAGEDLLESMRELKTSTVPAAVIEEARRNVARRPATAVTAVLVSDSAVMPHGLENPASEAVRQLRFRSGKCEINLQIQKTEATRSVHGHLDPPQRANVWVESESDVQELNATEPAGFTIHEIPGGLVSFHIQIADGDQFSTDWVTI